MYLLRKQVTQHTAAFYIQLVGVVQSIAAGYAILSLLHMHDYWSNNTALLIYVLQAIANGQLIVLVWHVHMQHILTFRFPFGLRDSYIPFLYAVVEFFIIQTSESRPYDAFNNFDYWLISMTIFMFLAVCAYWSFFHAAKGERANDKYFALVNGFLSFIRKYIFCVGLFCLASAGLPLIHQFDPCSKIAISIILNLAIIVFTCVHNHYFWTRLVGPQILRTKK